MAEIADVLADLDAESRDLDTLVAALPPADWARDTPAAGWTIAHQISHLAWTDQVAYLSTTDARAFAAALTSALADPEHFVDRTAHDGIVPAPELLAAATAAEAAGPLPSIYPASEGFVVAQVTARERATPSAFAAKKETVRADALRARQNELRTSYLDALKKTAKIINNQGLVGAAPVG